MLVAMIQAYVFTILSATYLGLAIAHGEHHDDHEEAAHNVHEPASLVPAEAES
jgi:hypothetical protein